MIDRSMFARKMSVAIIDCHGLLHSIKHGLKSPMTFNGQHTSIIYGFLLSLQTITRQLSPNFLVFAWDSRASLRKKQYPEYKRRKEKTKEEQREDLVAHTQFSLIRTDVLPTIGFQNSFIYTGLEADDIIAHLVHKYAKTYNFTVVSNDNDFLQLLDYCNLYSPSKKAITSKQSFIAEWGITPEQWIDIKAIGGCNSDTVKGIQGVGEKTAAKHLLGQLNPNSKAAVAIAAGGAIIARNRPLVSLPIACPLNLSLDFKNEFPSKVGFAEVCSRYGLQSFLEERLFNSICIRWGLR